ncbi:hypothetical protein C8F04DRAFT_1141183 [Mycena alexandri]|uniref:Uncharacterized protein n=1 Tax=Mycena alexandri TaxID=1745969 RepID=A0AAD6WQF4_9AGAR|nr:hypothetical protein C8F04DRAFT_1141183 [Mycena alexandri]
MFATELANTLYGRFPRPTALPAVHGHHAIPPQPHANNVPPPGLFRWHYLQCVLKKFVITTTKISRIYSSESDGRDSDRQ